MHPLARHGAAARKSRILAQKLRLLTRYPGDPAQLKTPGKREPATSSAGRERLPVDPATPSAGLGSGQIRADRRKNGPNGSANRTGCRTVWPANWAVRTPPRGPRIPPVGFRKKEGGGRAQVLNTNKKARSRRANHQLGSIRG